MPPMILNVRLLVQERNRLAGQVKRLREALLRAHEPSAYYTHDDCWTCGRDIAAEHAEGCETEAFNIEVEKLLEETKQ